MIFDSDQILLDEIFGVSLPEPEPHQLSKRFVLSRDYFTKQMNDWLRQGYTVEEYISGCDQSIQSDLRELAKTEGFL